MAHRNDQHREYSLTLESIDALCRDLEAFFEEKHAQKRESIRTRILAEDTLLKYRDHFGESARVELRTSNRPLRARVQVVVYCDRFNPFEQSDEDEILSYVIASSEKKSPYWQYVRSSVEWESSVEGRNEIIFTVPRENKVSTPVKLLLCLGAGVLLAAAVRTLLPPESYQAFAEGFVLPTANAYTGLLGVMAILLLFLSVPLCIVQYGNAAEFQKMTRNLVGTYVLHNTVLILLVFGISVATLGLDHVDTAGSGVIQSLYQVLLGFIPNSLFAPFLEFNCMQVMVIGALFGMAMLAMGSSNRTLVELFDKCNMVAVLTNSWLSQFVAPYAGVMIFYVILSSSASSLSRVAWLLVVVLGAGALLMLTLATAVSVRLRIPVLTVFKKVLPSFMINMSSASVSASFMIFFGELTNEFGVEPNYTGLSVNLGTIFFKPLYGVFLASTGFLAAHLTHTLSLQMALQIVFLSLVLQATIPNVPGGATAVIVLMLDQMGLGSQFTDIFVSINILLQYLIVPVNIFCTQCVAVLRAAREERLDMDKARKLRT